MTTTDLPRASLDVFTVVKTEDGQVVVRTFELTTIFTDAEETNIRQTFATEITPQPIQELLHVLRNEGAVSGTMFVIISQRDESSLVMELRFQQ